MAKYTISQPVDTFTLDVTAKFNITFDPSGGTVEPETKTVTLGSAYGELPIPKRNGYAFDVWITKAFPADYQEVEYIESHGIEYIKTSYIPNDTTGWDVNFQRLSSNNKDAMILGTKTGGNRCWLDVDCEGGKAGILRLGWNNYSEGPVTGLNRCHVLDNYLNDRTGYVNGEIAKGHNDNLKSKLSDQKYPMYIFGANDNGSVNYAGEFRLYYLKITEGEAVVLDLIPCRKIKTNEYGLYDLVNNQFYGAENGKLTGGKDISYHSASISEASIVTLHEDHSLIAVWKEDSVKLTFKLNGGKEETIEKTALRNVETSLSDIVFTRDGYRMTEWNTKADGTGERYERDSVVTFTEDTELFAQWEPENYTITFDPFGGTIEGETQKDVTYNATYGTLPEARRDGFIFIGWVDNHDLPFEYTQTEYIESHGTEYINTGYIPNDTTGWDVDFQKVINDNTDSMIIGSKKTNSDLDRCWLDVDNSGANGGTLTLGWNNYHKALDDNNQLVKVNLDRNHTIINLFNSRAGLIDGALIKSFNAALESKLAAQSFPMYIFGANVGGTLKYPGKFRLYSLMITEGEDTIIGRFIPCYEKESHEYGLYDAEHGAFYSNSGGGEITGGDDIITQITSETVVSTANDHTLFALWEKIPATVKLNMNDGSGKIKTIKLEY